MWVIINILSVIVGHIASCVKVLIWLRWLSTIHSLSMYLLLLIHICMIIGSILIWLWRNVLLLVIVIWVTSEIWVAWHVILIDNLISYLRGFWLILLGYIWTWLNHFGLMWMWSSHDIWAWHTAWICSFIKPRIL